MSNIGVDFDGTIIQAVPGHRKKLTPMVFIPGARETLQALKNQGHNLLLVSRRTNLARRFDPYLDPLLRAGVVPYPDDFNPGLANARFQQMLDFTASQLNGIIDAVDEGQQGRADVDYFIDDSSIRFRTWQQVASELSQMMAKDEAEKAARKRAERK